MEGILAVGGFWLFLIALVMKKPIMTYLENKKSRGVEETDSRMMERVNALEGSMVTMGKDIQEMKDTSEFAHKLMIDSAQQIAEAHKLLSKNSQDLAEAQRLLATAKHEAGTTQVTVIAQAKEEPKLIATSAPSMTARFASSASCLLRLNGSGNTSHLPNVCLNGWLKAVSISVLAARSNCNSMLRKHRNAMEKAKSSKVQSLSSTRCALLLSRGEPPEARIRPVYLCRYHPKESRHPSFSPTVNCLPISWPRRWPAGMRI